ncbi:MAG TPA: DNA polymerase III subunit beta [Chitinivibrionales bacterium]|nr:DNA polymerase III subunit beta [Chitinivibrionales bacterium]
MECVITKNKIFNLIQKAYPLIPLKTSLQILSNFKISISKKGISFSATDLDHSIIASAEAVADGEAEITVNARKLFEIIREMPEGDIHLSLDANVLIIENKKGFSCKIAGIGTEDFPAFPEIKNGTDFSVKVDSLKEMIIKSSFAVSKDESRTCLCGVLWKFERGEIGMVATDGHRLGYSFYKSEEKFEKNVSMIISPKSLLHLVRIIDEKKAEDTVQVSMSEKYVLFTLDSVKICSKLIDGPYPDYEKAIPKVNPKKAIIDKTLLYEAVKRVSILSNQKTHLVKFVFKNKKLEVVVLNRDIGGEARELLDIDYEGPEHTVGFNAQYLMEIISIISVTKIRMEMNTHISACLIFPEIAKESEKKSDDLFLIMPLRIMEES